MRYINLRLTYLLIVLFSSVLTSKSQIEGGCDLGGGFVLGGSVLPCHKRGGCDLGGFVRGVMSDHRRPRLRTFGKSQTSIKVKQNDIRHHHAVQ